MDKSENKQFFIEQIKENLTTLFPNFEFTLKGNKWVTPYHLNGERSSDTDQSYLYTNGVMICDNNGSEKLMVTDFYMQQRGISDFYPAMQKLCKELNVPFPSNYSDEDTKKYYKRLSSIEKAQKDFTEALYNPKDGQAVEVLDYLRNVRKWTDEEIKKGGIGYCPIENRYKYSEIGIPTDTRYRLTIPADFGGVIRGFKLRTLENLSNKYHNTDGLRIESFMGIPVGTKDVIIVEGELDCIRAKVNGVKNVVSTMGNAVKEKQVEDAIKRGVRNFTLLFDKDEHGYEFIKRSIPVIEQTGKKQKTAVRIWVTNFDTDVKDTDEYITKYGAQQYRNLFNGTNTTTSSKWEYYLMIQQYGAIQQQNGTLSDRQKADLLNGLTDIIDRTPAIFRKEIETLIQTQQDGLIVDWKELERLRKEKKREQEIKERNEQIKDLIQQANSKAAEGNTLEALQLMKEVEKITKSRGIEEEFNDVFMSDIDYNTFLSDIKKGIPTGYEFRQITNSGEIKEELTLNAGLTFICAYRGHGKTSFINNLVLNECRRNIYNYSTDGNKNSVLYFSYEIDKRRMILDLLNTYNNNPYISENPSKSILGYFKGEKNKYFNNVDGKYQDFKVKKEQFFNDFLRSRRLVVVDKNYKVETLLQAIKYYMEQYDNNVSMIAIDYAQLLYSEDYSRQRTEEIKKVVNDIKDFANQYGIPVVLAAQFNRQVDSPVNVTTENIGEGGDFERIADTAIGLFNLKELRECKAEKDSTKVRDILDNCGLTIGDLEPHPNKLFMRLMKRRNGVFPIDTILDWEGKTKYITPNCLSDEDTGEEYKWLTPQEPQEPQQGILNINPPF